MAMRKSRTLNLGTGTFVLLGFAALFFLTTQTTSRGMSFASPPHYDLTAKFDNIGDLKVGAPVSMSGVEMGRVTKIAFDSKEYKAVVTLRLDARYNQIPTDSDASIYTQGLLGGKFIGLTAGGAETYLKDKDQIDFTQSAFVLENLIGQVLANFTKSSGRRPGKSNAAAPRPSPSPRRKRNDEICNPRHAGLWPRGGRSAGAARRRRRAPTAPPDATLGPQELVENSAKRMLVELDANRADVREGSGEARCLGRQCAAAEFRHRICGAARAGADLAHRDSRSAQALRRCVLSFAAAQLRRGAGRFHRRPLHDSALQGRSRRHHGDRAHGSEALLRRQGAGRISACARPTACGRPGTSSSRAFPTSRASAPTSARRFSRRAWMKSSTASRAAKTGAGGAGATSH